MIRISIVTITFQAANTLKRTLDSVSRQRCLPFEHLIIDGASKDATVAMAKRYQEAASYRVIVTSEPDSGLYDAMNKGLGRATGDYIVFLNAGDCLHDERTLETVIKAAESSRKPEAHSLEAEGQPVSHTEQASNTLPAIIYGDTAITDGQGHFLHLRRLRPPAHLTWRSFRQGMLVCHQAFYARTDLARQTPYDLQYRHSADVDWCIRIMKEADRQGLPLKNTHTVLADFEDGGNTTLHHRASLMERYRVMAHHYGHVDTFLLHGWFAVRAVLTKLRVPLLSASE